jgi:polyisoprenoid-binding protein YceI
MKIKTLVSVIVAVLMFGSIAQAQKYLTKNGNISFFSSMQLENIEAHNNQVNAAIDSKTGDFVIKVLIKSFEFEKALMQEHFNENYMESDKFPNATLSAKIKNISEIDFAKDGSYPAEVEGKLTIHGVTKEVAEKGTITVKAGKVNAASTFNVKIADYGIKIPNTVVNNISETLEIKVDLNMEPLK